MNKLLYSLILIHICSNSMNNYENIQDIKNFKAELIKTEIKDYIIKYVNIITEFIPYNSSKKYYRTMEYNQNVTHQGIQSLFNIYHILLLYTNNIDLVGYHVQKAYYYYIEFISQINKEQHSFLQFNIKDAIMFIYKKSIFNLDKQIISIFKSDKDNNEIHNILRSITNKINHLILYVTDNVRIHINNTLSNDDKTTTKVQVSSPSSNSKVDEFDKLSYMIQKIVKKCCETKNPDNILSKINKVIEFYNEHIYKKMCIYQEKYKLKNRSISIKYITVQENIDIFCDVFKIL